MSTSPDSPADAPVNRQTPGPISPTLFASGCDELPGFRVADVVGPKGPDGEPERLANRRLLAAGFNSFDRAGRELGVDAAVLAETIDLVTLWRTAAIACGYPSNNAGVARFVRENARPER